MKKKSISRSPVWDLYRDGISYSMLCKYRNCKERFRLSAVEGLRPSERRAAMDFGTVFHKALELTASGKTTTQVINTVIKLYKDTSVDQMLVREACVLVPHYIAINKNSNIKYIAQERVFDIPYKSVTTGKIIRLRGRRDEEFIRNKKLWLQENKTKTTIDENKIIMTLPHDLQTMLYIYSMTHDYPDKPIGGVLYNVIRRPSTKQSAKETELQYLQRLSATVAKDPEHFFKRYEVELVQSDITNFFNQTLVPLIENVVIWWESIKSNPFNPWVDGQGNVNPHHYRTPFGIFDPMTLGVGDYFELTTTGRELGLVRVETVFPELQGEQGSVNKIATDNAKKNQ